MRIFENSRKVFENALKYSGEAAKNAWSYACQLSKTVYSSVSEKIDAVCSRVNISGVSDNVQSAFVNRRFAVRTALTAVAITLMLCSITGGTMAWLSAETPPLTNTFTYGDINITLTETDTDGDGSIYTNTYIMMPGNKITKDPVVTVKKGSESCWLFVKLEESENFDTFMEYTVADGWIELEGEDKGVYYRQVDKAEEDIVFSVLKDNEVKVKESVTKAMLNELDANGANNYPTLTIYSYAVQRDSEIEAIDTAAEAWELAVESSTEQD